VCKLKTFNWLFDLGLTVTFSKIHIEVKFENRHKIVNTDSLNTDLEMKTTRRASD